MHDWDLVKRLHKEGTPIKKIARNLKMSKNTVKKWIKLKEKPTYQRDHYPTKIDKYKGQIREWYLNPHYGYIGTRIFKELKKLGYNGSIGPIYRYLKSIKEENGEGGKKTSIRSIY